jgi:hypothetical protein
MTLMGKIFTMLILVMSIVFMTLSFMVFATHKNWKEFALNPTASPTTPLGLKPQLDQAWANVRALERELEDLRGQLAEHQAARRQALATLQSKMQESANELAMVQTQLQTLTTAHTEAVQKLGVAEANLEKVTTDNAGLRVDIVTIQKDRDEKLNRVVSLADMVNQAERKLVQLSERQRQLIDQVAFQKMTMEQHGIDVSAPLPTSLERPVDGVVTAVSEKEMVEISIGIDDGVREGHVLEVYRDNLYLGKIVVRRVTANRSVAQIDPNFKKGPIRKGDRVASKIS